jgi:gliding motility-associated-like protein
VVVLVIKNKVGCTDTAIKKLVIEDEFNLYVPDAFTPNGDGLNDVFVPKGSGISKYSLEIYNRWGEKIFHTTDFNTSWDGTYKGKVCKTDSYLWAIDLTDASGKRHLKSGSISLIRGAVKEE